MMQITANTNNMTLMMIMATTERKFSLRIKYNSIFTIVLITGFIFVLGDQQHGKMAWHGHPSTLLLNTYDQSVSDVTVHECLFSNAKRHAVSGMIVCNDSM